MCKAWEFYGTANMGRDFPELASIQFFFTQLLECEGTFRSGRFLSIGVPFVLSSFCAFDAAHCRGGR